MFVTQLWLPFKITDLETPSEKQWFDFVKWKDKNKHSKTFTLLEKEVQENTNIQYIITVRKLFLGILYMKKTYNRLFWLKVLEAKEEECKISTV